MMFDYFFSFNLIFSSHIITGNTNGDIFFYDKSLRVLYHLNVFVGDPITSISMLNNKMHIENGIKLIGFIGYYYDTMLLEYSIRIPNVNLQGEEIRVRTKNQKKTW